MNLYNLYPSSLAWWDKSKIVVYFSAPNFHLSFLISTFLSAQTRFGILPLLIKKLLFESFTYSKEYITCLKLIISSKDV